MRVRFGKLTAVLLTTTAFGLGAVELSADLEAHRQVHQMLARHAGLRIGGVSAEPFGGHLFLHDVAMGHGTTRVSIGTLVLPFPWTGTGLIGHAVAAAAEDQTGATAPPATGTASADNVTIVSGAKALRIKRIDLTGTRMTNADLARLLDTSSTESVESRLRKLDATSVVMPEVVAEDTTPGSERRAAFQQVALSGVVAGRITAGSVGGVLIAVKSGDDTLDGTTGAIQAYGVNLPQLARIAAGPRTDDAEPIVQVYDSLTVNAIKLGNSHDGVFSLATLKDTNVKARPLKRDWSKASGDNGKLSSADQAALLEDVKQSFAVGAIEMIAFSAKSSDAKGPQTFDIADFSLRDLAKGKIGGVSLHGVRFDSPKVKTGLGMLEIGPFALPAPQVAAASGTATNAMLPATLKLDLSKLDVDVAPKSDSEGANHFVMTVAHAGLVSEGESGDIPRSSKFTVEHVVFDAPPGNAVGQPLIDMGYGHLDLSVATTSLYDPSSQEFDLRDLTLKGVNMGSVGLGLQLVNVTKGIISPNQEIAKASLVAILVKGLSLDVTNEGFVDRLLAWRAKQDGMSVDDEKAFVVDFATNKLPASFNSANVTKIGAAIAKFIDKPKTLHIAILSKNGLGIGSWSMLADPALLIDSLEVTASANQ